MAPSFVMPDLSSDSSEPFAQSPLSSSFSEPQESTIASTSSTDARDLSSPTTGEIPSHYQRPPIVPRGDPPPNTKRCFVCLTDEPEDDPSIDWVTPCTCSLEGHHECLLAWVTDLEAQGRDLKCPVCKSAIYVVQRYDPVIWLNNLMKHGFSQWSPRILLGFVFAGAVFSSAAYGAKAISVFAGPDAVLAYLTKTETRDDDDPTAHAPAVHLLRYSSLPFIAPALILNRMSISDVATLPLSVVYVGASFAHTEDFYAWPPSPDRVFLAFYPILKATYFNLYKTVSDSLEKSWAAKARAMTVEQGPQATHTVVAAPEPAPARGGILDIDIDLQINGFGDDEDNGRPQAQNNGGPQRNRGADIGSRSPIEFITGALLWPGVCYGMGELMRRLLPSRFVNKPANGTITGLLQQRWGRSFVGGCLFVVLKDVFFLYVKYKNMMNQPYRRVKNSDKRNIRK